jgi:hypothetical protein
MKYVPLTYSDEQPWISVEWEQPCEESIRLAHQFKANGEDPAANPVPPATSATRVRIRNGKRLVTDGPFAETREQLGG